MPVVVKNTFLHFVADADPAPRRRCRSHSPTGSSQREAASPSAGGSIDLDASPPVAPAQRRQRPGKKRRQRFHRLVDRLVEKSLAEPAFAPHAEILPPSIAASDKKTQRVSALVAKLASLR